MSSSFISTDLNVELLTHDELCKLIKASWIINCEANSRLKLFKIQDSIKSLLSCSECFLYIHDVKAGQLKCLHRIQNQKSTSQKINTLLQSNVDTPSFTSSTQPTSASSYSSDFQQQQQQQQLPDPYCKETLSSKDAAHDFNSFSKDSQYLVDDENSIHRHCVGGSLSPSLESFYQCPNPVSFIQFKLDPEDGILGQAVVTGKSIWHYNPLGTTIVLSQPLKLNKCILHFDSYPTINYFHSSLPTTSTTMLRTNSRKHSSPLNVRSNENNARSSIASSSNSYSTPDFYHQQLSLSNSDEYRVMAYSSLAVPISDEKGIVGVIQVFNKLIGQNEELPTHLLGSLGASSKLFSLSENEFDTSHNNQLYCEFTQNDEVILKYFARLAGETLRSTDLLRDAEISRDRAAGLLTLLQSLKQNLSIQSALLTLSTHAKQLVRAADCVVYAIERKNKETPYLLSLSSDSGRELGIALSPSNKILFNCVTTGKTIVISDARYNREVAEMLQQISPTHSTLVSPRLSALGSTNISRSPTTASTPVSLGAFPVGTCPLLGSKYSGKAPSCPSDTDSDVSNSRRVSGRRPLLPVFKGPINNLCVVPIKAENQTTIGIIQLANKLDEYGDTLPFTDDDLQILEMFGSLVGPRLERSEFGLRATGGPPVTEAGRANNPAVIERSRRTSLSTPSEPVIREESDDDFGTMSGSDSSPRSSFAWLGGGLDCHGSKKPFGLLRNISSLERLSRISEGF